MWEREAGDRWGEVTINPGTDAAAAGWFVSSLIKTTQTTITRQTQTPPNRQETAAAELCLTVGLRFQMSASL